MKLQPVWICVECGTSIHGLSVAPKRHHRAMYHVLGLNYNPECIGKLSAHYSKDSLVGMIQANLSLIRNQEILNPMKAESIADVDYVLSALLRELE